MKGEWVYKPDAGTTIVYVHGFLSSGGECWKHKNGCYWPKMLNSEPDLKGVGIYVFTYETSIFSGNYRLSDVVDVFKELMQVDDVLDSEQLIFVCHSMGGLVTRKYLVERATELIEYKKKVGLFLIASPSLGSSYANWLGPLAWLLGHTQAKALKFVKNNDWLMDLDKEFTNMKEAGKLDLKGKELIEDKFVTVKSFWKKQIVEPFSGARYFGEPLKVPESDHFSIAKPEGCDAIQHRLLLKFIKSNFDLGSDDLSPVRVKFIRERTGNEHILTISLLKRVRDIKEEIICKFNIPRRFDGRSAPWELTCNNRYLVDKRTMREEKVKDGDTLRLKINDVAAMCKHKDMTFLENENWEESAARLIENRDLLPSDLLPFTKSENWLVRQRAKSILVWFEEKNSSGVMSDD